LFQNDCVDFVAIAAGKKVKIFWLQME